MSPTAPQAVQSCHELLFWLIPQLDKFPRARRFTLGERIEAGLLEVLELLVEAAGNFSGSFLRCEHFLQDCENGCEGAWRDPSNSFDEALAIHSS